MSITVNQKPDNNSPAYNDLNFVVSESSGTIYSNPNFKYICDVYNNSTLLARLKAPIYPNSTNKGVFNISRLIENFVTYDWDINDANVSGCPNSYYGYMAKFGYEYSTGTTSPIITASGLTNVTGLTAYNMALNPIDFANFDELQYLNTSSAAKFLTSNRNKTIHRTQKDWIYLWKGDAGSIEVTYQPSNTTVVYPLGLISDKVIRLPFVSIPSGTTYFDVVTKKSGGTTSSETYRVYIKDECSKYDTNDVYFLNRYGAVESFRFNRLRRDKFNVVRKQYKSTPYTLSGSLYSYDTSSKSKSNYYTEANQMITLNSNWISEEESTWLKELIMSPYIWILDSGVLKSINIVNSDYETKKTINDKLFNLTIDCEISFTDKVQRL